MSYIDGGCGGSGESPRNTSVSAFSVNDILCSLQGDDDSDNNDDETRLPEADFRQNGAGGSGSGGNDASSRTTTIKNDDGGPSPSSVDSLRRVVSRQPSTYVFTAGAGCSPPSCDGGYVTAFRGGSDVDHRQHVVAQSTAYGESASADLDAVEPHGGLQAYHRPAVPYYGCGQYAAGGGQNYATGIFQHGGELGTAAAYHQMPTCYAGGSCIDAHGGGSGGGGRVTMPSSWYNSHEQRLHRK